LRSIDRSREIDAFTLDDLAKLTGMNPVSLKGWIRLGIVKPSVRRGAAGGPGSYKHLFNFRDVVSAYVAQAIRSQGLDLKKVLRIATYVRKRSEIALAEEPPSVLVVLSGEDLYEVDDLAQLRQRSASGVMLVFSLHRLVAEVQRGVRDLGRAAA
jgi:DNA-binding transcriptional MerR regulator